MPNTICGTLLVLAVTFIAPPTAEARGQRRLEITTPSDPLIPTDESCAKQLADFDALIAQSKAVLDRLPTSNPSNQDRSRESPQCLKWWNSSSAGAARFTCSVSPSRFGAVEAYYYLQNERDAAGPLCRARVAEQRAMRNALRDAIDPAAPRSDDRSQASAINDRVREAGERALGPGVAGKAFDGSMGAIGLTNDQVLKQLEDAFATIERPGTQPDGGDFGALSRAIAAAGQNVVTAAAADQMLRAYRARLEKGARSGIASAVPTAVDDAIAKKMTDLIDSLLSERAPSREVRRNGSQLHATGGDGHAPPKADRH
jgi:hypothetical protein